jgi:hypothetical protein
MKHEKEPLYRRVNTRALRCTHNRGGDFRHARNTKRAAANDATRGRMQGRSDRGLDYTPLFRFLLSRVGTSWDAVHREALARLDHEDPIYWLVARREEDKQAHVRVGESTYFSGLFVDADGILQRVDEALRIESLVPSCACCTHTFNGVPFVQRYRPTPP